MRVISYGGGVQSTALLVLAARGELGHVDAALFSNVGDDSEQPETLRYVRNIAVPFGAAHGVPVVELCRYRRDESVDTVLKRIERSEVGSTPIPMRDETGAPGIRSCTIDFKMKVVNRWVQEHGATEAEPAEVLIGFSWDEAHRVGDWKRFPNEVAAYPLLDRRLTQMDCQNLIRRAGLPIPPKSACYFCPFHKPSTWAKMRRDEPLLFFKSAEIEAAINAKRTPLGKPPMYLTRFGKPLAEAINGELQEEMDFGAGLGETCDEGYCWT